MNVLLDTNILLDYLQKRAAFASAEKILNLCADKKISCFMAAHSIPDIYYILRKTFSDADRRTILLNLISLVPVISIDQTTITSALLNSSFIDFEDCLQSECASCVSAEYIVTRNVEDFSRSTITPITPDAFLSLLEL